MKLLMGRLSYMTIALCNGVRGLKYPTVAEMAKDKESHSVMECVD